MVPKFHEIMLPLLQLATDGQAHRLSESIPALASTMHLTDEDLAEKIPSGQSRFANRAYWAKLYLSQAKALESSGAGTFSITDRGRKLLDQAQGNVDVDTLMQFPEFVAFRAKSRAGQKQKSGVVEHQANDETPSEAILSVHRELREAVIRDLLDSVRRSSPEFLEKLVIALLLEMGYGDKESDTAGVHLGGVHDGGVDGLINRDRLGLGTIYVQTKRYAEDNVVGSPAIQQFVGSVQERRAREGVFVTTSSFSKDARDSAQRAPIQIALIDGHRLAELMYELNVGVSIENTLTLKKVDGDFFS